MTQLAALYDVLENLTNLHRALYTLAVEKKEVLIKGDLEALTRITQQEQKLVRAVEANESSRIELVRKLFAEKGASLSEGSLLELIKLWTGAEEKLRLTNYRNELIRIVSELRTANELNQQLLEQSLSFVNHSLDLLTYSPEEDFLYKKPTGYNGNNQASRSFINKKA
jgi:flagellar biosynthesis/type III secretory pathway chaperone